MASNNKFLTEPDDSLKCVICLEVAKDPKQHEDCGKLFCSECILEYGNKPCPICRAKNPQYFKDRRSLREIRDLRVKCDNVERGCDWEGTVGTFDDHVTKCGFILVSCPNTCKFEGEESQVMRKDLDEHLETKCLNRVYKCKHCGEKGTYANITEVHDGVCIKKVVPCPNTDCTVTMKRGQTKKHVQTVCKYTVVACKYASIGCSVKKMRNDMNQHKEDDKSHLHLALDRIVKLVNTTSSLEDTISSLKTTTYSLEATTSSLEDTTSMLKKNVYTLCRNKSITFNLPGYKEKKEDNILFYSEPFYTSPGGYKMGIIVYPNGVNDGTGSHVSVFSKLLEGPYNDSLSWPFLGTVTVHLLNQLEDGNHHCFTIRFNTTVNAHVNRSRGYSEFIPHSMLSHGQACNTQYLVEDTLYFRVTVEVDHHKPWLDCTHHN